MKETCDFDFPKKEGNVFKSVLTNTVQQVNSNEILDDFIIDLDDSLEIEEQESEKIDPLADTDETAATGTHIDAKTLEIEKKSEVALLSNLIQMTEDSTDEAVENMKKPIKSKCTSNEENFVICIDTDDEDEKQSESILNADVIKQPDEPSKEINPLELTVIEISATSDINTRTESQTENKKRNSDELSSPNQETDQQISNEPPLKMPRLPKLIECVNIMCPKIYNSTYTTASKFILHFFYVPSKLNREQFVCNFCTDNAVDKFEMISGALLQGERVCDLELPKRAELVEIIDSDEESVSENNNEGKINKC